MTRDEQRVKCIEAMARAYFREAHDDDEKFEDAPTDVIQACMEVGEALFDSFHGLVRVMPIEATEEMLMRASIASNTSPKNLWRVMSAAGDLTNAPEKKP